MNVMIIVGCKIKTSEQRQHLHQDSGAGEEPVFVVMGRKEDVTIASMTKKEIHYAAEYFL